MVCPTGEVARYFGWKSTECGNCSIYGTYIEYLTPPKIRDIDPDGPANGRLQENDVLLGIDGELVVVRGAILPQHASEGLVPADGRSHVLAIVWRCRVAPRPLERRECERFGIEAVFADRRRGVGAVVSGLVQEDVHDEVDHVGVMQRAVGRDPHYH